ncbi:MAG TPA: hypothetical protein PKX93_07385 [bacterium]|nr:hypothetical protein [bacterium]HPP12503.1 hypothetical protein [bacterium]
MKRNLWHYVMVLLKAWAGICLEMIYPLLVCLLALMISAVFYFFYLLVT